MERKIRCNNHERQNRKSSSGRNRRDQCVTQGHRVVNFFIRLREDVVIDEALTRNGAVKAQQRFCYQAVCGKSCGRKKAETKTGRKPLKRDITYRRGFSTARNKRFSANTARLEVGHTSVVRAKPPLIASLANRNRAHVCASSDGRAHGSDMARNSKSPRPPTFRFKSGERRHETTRVFVSGVSLEASAYRAKSNASTILPSDSKR